MALPNTDGGRRRTRRVYREDRRRRLGRATNYDKARRLLPGFNPPDPTFCHGATYRCGDMATRHLSVANWYGVKVQRNRHIAEAKQQFASHTSRPT
jgi:hypothetical protein